jgi:rhodanese-related sulfurtransferase
MKLKNWTLAVTAAFITLGLSSISAQAKKADCPDSKFSEISKEELKAQIDAGTVFLVDVNGKSSYEEKHIGNAVHFGTHKEDFSKILPKDKSALIVAYCGGPSCSAWKKAAKEACGLNYTNVKYYKGGLSGWFKS